MNTVILNTTQKVGTALKAYRERVGVSQGVIAKKARISTSMLSQIERGTTSPSIETLAMLCKALKVDMSQLFSFVEEKRSVSIKKEGERLTLKQKGAHYEQVAWCNAAAGSMEMFLLTVEPDSAVGFSGKEQSQEGVEMGYILLGEAVLSLSGEEYPLSEGDGVSFSAALSHAIINRSKKPFVAVWAAMPSQRDYLDIE